MLTFRTKIKGGEVLSDLGRPEAHQVGCRTALGVGSTLEKLESRPGFKRCGLHLTFFLPSSLSACSCPLMSACVPLSPLANASGLGRDGFARLPSLMFLKGGNKVVGVEPSPLYTPNYDIC